MTDIKIGDKIAAAVLSYKHAALRVGVVEKVHPPTRFIHEVRYTIRDDKGQAHIVSAARAIAIERDEFHTMDELYYYRMLYNAHAARAWDDMGKAVKSWRHHDGELCFNGGWFIVVVDLPTGQVSNHYRAEFWDLFHVPEVEKAPEWDGHTPAEAAERLRLHLIPEYLRGGA